MVLLYDRSKARLGKVRVLVDYLVEALVNRAPELDARQGLGPIGLSHPKSSGGCNPLWYTQYGKQTIRTRRGDEPVSTCMDGIVDCLMARCDRTDGDGLRAWGATSMCVRRERRNGRDADVQFLRLRV